MAKESIVLVDNYVDEDTLKILEQKESDVRVTVCSRNQMATNERNVRRRKTFQAGFRFIESNLFRNNYVLIDEKILYMLSRSLKYNGQRAFWYIQIFDINEIKRIRDLIFQGAFKMRCQYRHF